jgi:hypothetical protein
MQQVHTFEPQKYQSPWLSREKILHDVKVLKGAHTGWSLLSNFRPFRTLFQIDIGLPPKKSKPFHGLEFRIGYVDRHVFLSENRTQIS